MHRFLPTPMASTHLPIINQTSMGVIQSCKRTCFPKKIPWAAFQPPSTSEPAESSWQTNSRKTWLRKWSWFSSLYSPSPSSSLAIAQPPNNMTRLHALGWQWYWATTSLSSYNRWCSSTTYRHTWWRTYGWWSQGSWGCAFARAGWYTGMLYTSRSLTPPMSTWASSG